MVDLRVSDGLKADVASDHVLCRRTLPKVDFFAI
jgi:hypothetical protein